MFVACVCCFVPTDVIARRFFVTHWRVEEELGTSGWAKLLAMTIKLEQQFDLALMPRDRHDRPIHSSEARFPRLG